MKVSADGSTFGKSPVQFSHSTVPYVFPMFFIFPRSSAATELPQQSEPGLFREANRWCWQPVKNEISFMRSRHPDKRVLIVAMAAPVDLIGQKIEWFNMQRNCPCESHLSTTPDASVNPATKNVCIFARIDLLRCKRGHNFATSPAS